VGPIWWHQRSIGSAYSFLREAFVHEPTTLKTMIPVPLLRTTVIPHGPYRFPAPVKPREVTRGELGIPADATVLLSFGHVRDGKNLDLILKVLAQFQRVFLIVAGTEQSQGQKPASSYQNLARETGVEKRCRWVIRFIDEKEIGNFFNAADFVLLTYSRAFRSASGVLNVAAHYRKPCLASSGQGNLESVVKDYRLGVWVDPDSEASLTDGLALLLQNPPDPHWSRYEREHSWERNAQLVVERMFENARRPEI
jgi:glycosyltransferase involved in cell wall biosynthesis